MITPGPWKWDGETLRGKDRNAIFNPLGRRWSVQDRINHEADARLIASAPDLLAALEQLSELAEHSFRGHGVTKEMVRHLTRAAIAKATGTETT